MTDAEQMKELLAYANYAKVAAALRVSRNAVSAWANGRDVTPYRVTQVRDLLRPAVEPPMPQWAERSLALVSLLAQRSGITPEEIAAEADRVAAAAVAGSRGRARDGGAAAPESAGSNRS